MSEENSISGKNPEPIQQNGPRKAIIYASVVVIAFLLGLIPMWMTAYGRGKALGETQRDLKRSQIEITIASAVIDARRAEYEPARQTASVFFTTVLAELERGKDSVFTNAERESVRPILANRDTIITLLARNDPASVERLSELYINYRSAVQGAKMRDGSSG
ncbi:MAG TPA: hypothetical protein DCR97_01285 [Deltaproteobacteria bacterium]|nr:hypothetical protein [Deltaproteobacteria bacterium]